jgi:hypothetical protein
VFIAKWLKYFPPPCFSLSQPLLTLLSLTSGSYAQTCIHIHITQPTHTHSYIKATVSIATGLLSPLLCTHTLSPLHYTS